MKHRFATKAELRRVQALSPIRIGSDWYLLKIFGVMPPRCKDYSGCIHRAESVIHLSAKQSFPAIVSTLHHEIIHAVFWERVPSVDFLENIQPEALYVTANEFLTSAIQEGLVLAYLDNPGLLPLLTTVYGGGKSTYLKATFKDCP